MTLHPLVATLTLVIAHGVSSFQVPTALAPEFHILHGPRCTALEFSSRSTARNVCVGATNTAVEPQVVVSGFSSQGDLIQALQEATATAVAALPPPSSASSTISLAIAAVSSLYDSQSSPILVVPTIVASALSHGRSIENLIGCYAGGLVGSMPVMPTSSPTDDVEDKHDSAAAKRACVPIESEGIPGVSITLCILPDVDVKTFYVEGEDVPDDVGRFPMDMWKKAVGLQGVGRQGDEQPSSSPAFMLLPSPAFQNDLDDFLRGLDFCFPGCKTFGAIASTVSSLSRPRLFRYDAKSPQSLETLADGCVGVALSGDVEVRVMVAQGAKPVGGIYRVVSGQDSTIGVIVLDETATQELRTEEEEAEEDEEEEEEEDSQQTARERAAAAYAKANIPKPVLAEANFLMRTLSDDDRAFMRKALLVGLERGGSLGRSPAELARLAAGQGHRFRVHQVASAGMKDGSVTLPLGSVMVQKGTRMRFYVREGSFAKREVEALWMGHKKRSLEEVVLGGKTPFTPTACMIFPTLDRGSKLFGGGRSGYESSTAAEFLPTVSSISGFFSNGVLGRLDDSSNRIAMDIDTESGISEEVLLHGSASCFVLLGSKSNRPTFSALKESEEAKEDVAEEMKGDDDLWQAISSSSSESTTGARSAKASAPRSEDGELILRRREVHSGRAISVSTVEWSVAEKTAAATSALEGFMWDKEAEVDRFRERVPLSNLVSQCRAADADPTMPKPRDWIGALLSAAAAGPFVIVPECKRTDPGVGKSLRRRYDVAKLARQFAIGGAPVLSVSGDAVLFGGSSDDVAKARGAAFTTSSVSNSIETTPLEVEESPQQEEEETKGAVTIPPILASDLILYPYQLYRLRLAGADAAVLVAGALTGKDLLYLTKISSSLRLQSVISVTSPTQIQRLSESLSPGSFAALILSNRDLETFGFDQTGQQALNLLQSDALKSLREKHGSEFPILVEENWGASGDRNEDADSFQQYIQQLKEHGATGVILGGRLAELNENDGTDAYQQMIERCR